MRRLAERTLSFRLWNQFWGHIPDHPLMRAVRTTRQRGNDLGISPILIGGLLLFGLPMLWVVGFSMALMAIAMGGTLRGMAVAVLTARALHHERDTGRLDALGLTPAGTLGVGWVLAQREFRRGAGGQFVNRYIQNAQRVIGTAVVGIVALVTLSVIMFELDGVVDLDGSARPALNYVLGSVQMVLVGALWLVMDNAQAPMMGITLGFWGGMAGRRTYEAGVMAAAGFAVVQVGLYGPMLVLWLALAGLPDSVRLALPILLMIAAREVTLRGLWRRVCTGLNATGAEIPSVLRL